MLDRKYFGHLRVTDFVTLSTIIVMKKPMMFDYIHVDLQITHEKFVKLKVVMRTLKKSWLFLGRKYQSITKQYNLYK